MDLTDALWRIPAVKMKMRHDHFVALSTQAVEILRELERMTGGTDGRCMSENTVSAALRSMGYAKDVMTAHGFRAMARTMLDEILEERVDLIEHQLAHAVIDPNGRAYNRTAHLPGRRTMMQRWADTNCVAVQVVRPVAAEPRQWRGKRHPVQNCLIDQLTKSPARFVAEFPDCRKGPYRPSKRCGLVRMCSDSCELIAPLPANTSECFHFFVANITLFHYVCYAHLCS
jgi:hypothetical protein